MAIAATAINPPMKPPPGSLWPRSSTNTENSSIRLVSAGAIVRKISVRISGLSRGLCRRAAGHAHERQYSEAGDHHDGDLAECVEAAEVDDDDVDDVAAVRDGACVGGEELAQPFVERELDGLHQEQTEAKATGDGDSAVDETQRNG